MGSLWRSRVLGLDVAEIKVVPLVAGYALCSSLLAIINKCAITAFPYPSILTALQYLTCVISVLFLGRIKVLEHEALRFGTLRRFLPAAGVFYLAIFTNTTLFKYANVDTFIVFRSSTPLLVAVADTVFRSQPWPNRTTFVALFVILLGAVGYVATDHEFSLRAYSWAFAYLFTITLEMVYIKHVVTNLGLTTWGFVLYNNFLSLLISPLFWLASGEYRDMATADMTKWRGISVLGPVLLSCVFGLAISFFGFACRRAVTATTFTVVGVTNKLLTVIINVLIWEKHASVVGVAFLLLTIVGGLGYQQSTKPGTKTKPKVLVQDEEANLTKVETSSDDENSSASKTM